MSKPEKIFLVPREGIKVREPVTGFHFPDSGKAVTPNSYYNRRIADGDLIIRKPEKRKAKQSENK